MSCCGARNFLLAVRFAKFRPRPLAQLPFSATGGGRLAPLFDQLEYCSIYNGLIIPCFYEKSRIFRGLFRQIQNTGHFLHDLSIIFPAMGTQAVGAVLDPIGRIAKAAAALIAQSIQGAIAEQTAEGIRVCAPVTGEIFAILILKKIIMGHKNAPSVISF